MKIDRQPGRDLGDENNLLQNVAAISATDTTWFDIASMVKAALPKLGFIGALKSESTAFSGSIHLPVLHNVSNQQTFSNENIYKFDAFKSQKQNNQYWLGRTMIEQLQV